MMSKFDVHIESTLSWSLQNIEASSEEEAVEIAEDMLDGGFAQIRIIAVNEKNQNRIGEWGEEIHEVYGADKTNEE